MVESESISCVAFFAKDPQKTRMINDISPQPQQPFILVKKNAIEWELKKSKKIPLLLLQFCFKAEKDFREKNVFADFLQWLSATSKVEKLQMKADTNRNV